MSSHLIIGTISHVASLFAHTIFSFYHDFNILMNPFSRLQKRLLLFTLCTFRKQQKPFSYFFPSVKSNSCVASIVYRQWNSFRTIAKWCRSYCLDCFTWDIWGLQGTFQTLESKLPLNEKDLVPQLGLLKVIMTKQNRTIMDGTICPSVL